MNNIAHKHGFGISGKVRHVPSGSDILLPKIKGFTDDQPNDSVYSGRIFPSGDFSVGIIPKKKITNADKQYEAVVAGSITSKAIRWKEGEEEYVEVGTICRSVALLPNLVNPAKFTQSSRKPYGQGGITTYGKRMVASAATILEREWGKRCTGFGTLTLPPMSAQQEIDVCMNWSKLVNRFFEELRRHQRRHGVDERYVHVTEIQEKRWTQTGSLGLHIHFLYKARKYPHSKGWAISANWCRDTWRRILANSLGMSALEVPQPRCELSLVKKSAAGYLGKYMSKGGKVLADIKEEKGFDCVLPRQWWGLCNFLRADIKGKIIHLCSQRCALLWSLVSSGDTRLFSYTRQVEITSDVWGVRSVGVYGRINTFLVSFVAELLTSGLDVT